MCLFCGGDFGCTLASWLRRSVCHKLVEQILVVRKLPLEGLKLVVVGGGLDLGASSCMVDNDEKGR